MQIFKTLGRMRRGGSLGADPIHLELMTGLSPVTVTSHAPWLRSFKRDDRHVLWTEVDTTALASGLVQLSWHIRRPLEHAVYYGRWPTLRDVFTASAVELAEAMMSADRSAPLR